MPPAQRKPGMDQDWYDWSPISTRPRLVWPDGARVALCVIVNLEWYEFNPPADHFIPLALQPDLSIPPNDYVRVSHRDYGNRVGIFRVMEVLDNHGIRATAAIDAAVAESYPFVVEQCLQREWEFIGHGQAVSHCISSNMTEAEERAYIEASLDSVEAATGVRPLGWFGPEYGESLRTPGLLAEAGVEYLCDFPNDEQPYPMKVPTGRMVSLPILLEMDDLFTHGINRTSIWRWAQVVEEGFDCLYEEGAQQGRLLTLNLHPWLIGQPHRIKYLDQALGYITRHEGVWKATGSEIVDYYRSQETSTST